MATMPPTIPPDPMGARSPKRRVVEEAAATPGIKEIARELQVSIGTVDRALHGRAGVSPKTKKRVLALAGKLGYRPNVAAQALKLNRRLSIAAVLPLEISHFFLPLRAGIQQAADTTTGVQITLDFIDYPHLGSGDEEAFERAMAGRYDGILFIPNGAKTLSRPHGESGSTLFCVGDDVPQGSRSGAVTVDATISGSMAAELLALKLQAKGSVAVFSGDLALLNHSEKLRGFAATLAVQAPHLSLLPVLENHEEPQQAYEQALCVLQQRERPSGLYLSTANSAPVFRALRELGLLGRVAIVTTDLFHELVPLIGCGHVLATLYQRPFTQGKLAFESLLHLLRGERMPETTIRLAPHVIFRSNLPLFQNQLRSGTKDESFLHGAI